jgi:hypothetical protein
VSDVIFIAVLIVFFVLCALYVQLCDRMIGSDEMAPSVKGDESDADGEPATLTTTIPETTAGVTA